MKICQFKSAESATQRLGLLVGGSVIDIGRLASAADDSSNWLRGVNSSAEVITRGEQALAAIRSLQFETRDESTGVPVDSIEFLPAVWPGKILAIGRNYIDHAIEGGAAPPAAPLIFTKLPNAVSSHNAPIRLPSISTAVDYESELAVVIGRRASRVTEADALDYVFGYTLINDVTARDLQYGDGQWVRGKGLDTFAPLGPFITTRDEIPDVHTLKIEGRLNGEVMQSSNTAKMIFKVPFLVSYISQAITLEPGDVIATGTPEGVGYFRKPPVLLKPGDVFEVTIEGLGTLRNTVVGAE